MIRECVVILLALAKFEASALCTTSITSCVSTALDKIESSSRYTLLPGLYFLRSHNSSEDADVGKISLTTKAERLFRSHDLRWNALPGVELTVRNGGDGFSLGVERSSSDIEDTSRTFGFRRRLKMVLLPIMFKLGVITTLLAMLTIFSLKGLTIGILLLALALGSLFSKLKLGHSSHGWEPSWEPHKEVHFHVHPFSAGHGAHWQRMDPWSLPEPAYYSFPQYQPSQWQQPPST